MGGRLGWLWAFVRAGSVAATPDATTSLMGPLGLNSPAGSGCTKR